MLAKALVIALMGYLGSGATPQSQDLHEREVIMYVRPGVIQAPAGQKALTLDAVTMPDELRNVLMNYSAEYLTRPYPDYDPSDTIAYSPYGRPVKKMDLSRLYRVRFPEGTDLDSVVADLKDVDGVIFAERIPLLQLMAIPNDEFFPYQWGLHNTGQAGGTPGEDIHAVEAWDIFKGSSNVKIGIIDAGVQNYHEDLQGKVVSGESGYSDPHGTHVAGIAAAMTNNETGVAGVDWNAKIDARDISSFDPSEIYDDIVASVDAGSDVLNNSWGEPDYSVTIRWAFHYAYEMDRVQVASMGNTGGEDLRFPAGFPVVLAVGATTNNGTRSPFSTYGNHIDVVAPGGTDTSNTAKNILSTWTTNAFQGRPYRFLAGTSMSSPFVTGLAALLKGFRPELTNDDIMWIIKVSADDKPPAGWDEYTGYGRINAERALNFLRLPYEVHHLAASGGTVYGSTDFYSMAFLAVPGLADGVYIVKRYEVRKSITVNSDYVEKHIWGIHTTSTGFSMENPNFGENWTGVVSVNGNQVTLRTYVYDVYTIAGEHVGWVPTAPENVTFGYTVLGRREISAPSSLTLESNEATITLSWQDNSDNEMGFLIYRSEDGQNFSVIDTVWTNGNGTGERAYTDENVEFGNTYWYKVQAFAQNFYSEFSNTDTISTNLARPGDVTASVSSDLETITLTWTDRSNYEEGYEIWRKSPEESSWQRVGIVPQNQVSFVDSTVQPDHLYAYRIRAYSGDSIFSDFSSPVIVNNYSTQIRFATSTPPTGYTNGEKLVHGDGGYYMVYVEDGEVVVRRSVDGINWGEREVVSGGMRGCEAPAINITGDGRLEVVFRLGTDIFYTKESGGVWTKPMEIAKRLPVDSTYGLSMADGGGVTVVAWVDYVRGAGGGDRYKLRVAWSDDGEYWRSETLEDVEDTRGGMHLMPEVAGYDGGVVLVYASGSELRYREFDGEEWSDYGVVMEEVPWEPWTYDLGETGEGVALAVASS